MDKRPHAPDCLCYKCEAEQFSAARAAKDKADERLARTACSAGSMLRCYWAFIEYYPWKKSEFPTYDLWICSDADDARIFRQGWAARCSTLESLPNDAITRPPSDEPRRVPAGALLGVLQWHAADGQVRRWVIRQGERMNGIRVCARGKVVECGWDRLFRALRTKLAVPKRTLLTEVTELT
jgi:hypothetical protein